MSEDGVPDISQEQVIIPTIVQEAAASAQLGNFRNGEVTIKQQGERLRWARRVISGIPNFVVFRKLVEAMLQRHQHPSSVKKRNRRRTRKPYDVQ